MSGIIDGGKSSLVQSGEKDGRTLKKNNNTTAWNRNLMETSRSCERKQVWLLLKPKTMSILSHGIFGFQQSSNNAIINMYSDIEEEVRIWEVY